MRAWRMARGYTMEEAAAKVVVAGEPCNKSTWHGWENGKVPKPPWMIAVCDLTGLEPNDFYPRAAAVPAARRSSGNGGEGGKPGAGNGDPPQMALAL